MNQPSEIRLHSASFNTGGLSGSVYCVACVSYWNAGESTLLYCNLIGGQSELKAIRAGLGSGDRNVLESFSSCDHGYTFTTQKAIHPFHNLIAISRDPAFFPVWDDESVWDRLRSTAITTPVLRSWVPVIRKTIFQLARRREEVNMPHAQYVPFDTATIDHVVSLGVKNGILKLQDESVETVLAEVV